MGETVVLYDEQLNGSSSAFDTAFWSKHERTLFIKFWNGTVVSYSGFGDEEWNRFSSSMSKGSYYNSKIKGNFAFRGEMMSFPVAFKKREVVTANDFMVDSADTNHSPEAPVNITVNIFFAGDPEAIAKAVERFAPSIKALKNFGKV